MASDGGVIRSGDALATFEGFVDFAADRMPEAFDVFPEADVVVIGNGAIPLAVLERVVDDYIARTLDAG